LNLKEKEGTEKISKMMSTYYDNKKAPKEERESREGVSTVSITRKILLQTLPRPG
jgi:hypothetical protein